MVTGTGPDRLSTPPQGSPCLRPSSGLRSSPAFFFFPQVESSVNGAHQKRALFPNRCVKLLGTENAPRREAAPATLKVESLGKATGHPGHGVSCRGATSKPEPGTHRGPRPWRRLWPRPHFQRRPFSPVGAGVPQPPDTGDRAPAGTPPRTLIYPNTRS